MKIILRTPLLAPFLDEVRSRDDEWCAWLLDRMTRRLSWEVPDIWSERINLTRTPALYRRLMRGETITIDQLLRSHANRHEFLACEVLYLVRDDDDDLGIPAANTPVRAGDELLLAGRPGARGRFSLNLTNEHSLNYILTGTDLPGGWVWEKLSQRKQKKPQRHLP